MFNLYTNNKTTELYYNYHKYVAVWPMYTYAVNIKETENKRKRVHNKFENIGLFESLNIFTSVYNIKHKYLLVIYR